MRSGGSMFAKVAIVLACATGLALLIAIPTPSADTRDSGATQAPAYSPYPVGLIPKDLDAETDRVNHEIEDLEQEAMSQWRSLQKNGGTAMRQVQLLGKIEMYDKNLSVNRNEACAFCHMPYTGFSGPISSLNATVVAYPGSAQRKRRPC